MKQKMLEQRIQLCVDLKEMIMCRFFGLIPLSSLNSSVSLHPNLGTCSLMVYIFLCRCPAHWEQVSPCPPGIVLNVREDPRYQKRVKLLGALFILSIQESNLLPVLPRRSITPSFILCFPFARKVGHY